MGQSPVAVKEGSIVHKTLVDLLQLPLAAGHLPVGSPNYVVLVASANSAAS